MWDQGRRLIRIMIWLLRICFSLLPAAPLLAGSVSGRVELSDSKDAAVRKQKDYSGVVVWLEPVAATAPASAEQGTARMIQKDKTFSPHVLAIRVGSLVDFPNFDPIFHNAFSNYDGRVFDVGLYPPGKSRAVRFNRAGIVRVFCNIHATMSAVIVVLNTPYFDTTQKSGNFKIPDVPPGDYWLRVFHERATEVTLNGLTRRVTAGAELTNVGPIVISESGYLAIPHQNKYGHDYTAAPDEGGVYPAVRK
jgi:plastocyanin